MSFFRISRAIFVPACIAVLPAVLPAQTTTPTVSLNGNYVLAEQGTSSTGEFASVAMLTFADGGMVSGTQFLRTTSGMQQIAVQGTYTFDGVNVGMLSLNTTSQDTDGNEVVTSMNYQFAFSATEIQAMRTDFGQLSVAYMFPAASTVSGAFAFSQIDPLHSAARVASINVDNLGNITGTSLDRNLGSVTSTVLSGSYSQTGNTPGQMILTTQGMDSDGNATSLNETYATVAARDRVVALRTDAGAIGLTFLSR